MNFYRDASDILDKLELKKGTIKGLCLDPSVRDKKKMYALICQTLKFKPIMKELLDSIKFSQQEKMKLSKNLVLVLIHDLLFRTRGIQAPAGPIKSHIQGFRLSLKAELAKLKIKRGVLDSLDLINDPLKDQVPIPRYVRVNTLLTKTETVIQEFIYDGYQFTTDVNIDWRSKTCKNIAVDQHIRDVLLLPSSIDLHDHWLSKEGHIILQDKASCFPAYILNSPPGAHVIDACAAPGNKTSHLAAIMGNKGHIQAYDLDSKRLNTLKRLTGRAGCKIIEPIHGSFLEISPDSKPSSKVEYVLLDPSCSGSGIVNRLDYLVDTDQQEDGKDLDERLESLAEFQIQCIEHAMKFPNVRQIVYSTCSVHGQENEGVVGKILENHSNEWHLVKCLPEWKRRGLVGLGLSKDDADKVVRCDPSLDATNGFFVALFQRKTESAQDQPINSEFVKEINAHPFLTDAGKLNKARARFHEENNLKEMKRTAVDDEELQKEREEKAKLAEEKKEKEKAEKKNKYKVSKKRKIFRPVTSG